MIIISFKKIILIPALCLPAAGCNASSSYLKIHYIIYNTYKFNCARTTNFMEENPDKGDCQRKPSFDKGIHFFSCNIPSKKLANISILLSSAPTRFEILFHFVYT